MQTDRSIWHKSAPEKIRRIHEKGDLETGWTRWREHLAKRSAPIPPAQLWSGEGSMLLDEAGEAGVDGQTRRLLLSLQWLLDDQSCWNEKSEAWLEGVLSGPIDTARALESLGWAHALPAAAAKLQANTWWKLLDQLGRLAQEACEMPLDGQPLVQQLLGGELSLTLAYLFPEITPCRKAAKAARKVLSSGMLELIDGEGLPSSQILDIFSPLMACWTRCRILGRHMEKGCASAKAGYQYEWAIRAALRLSRADGSQVFSRANGHAGGSQWMTPALAYGGDENDQLIASLVLPGRKASNKGIDEARLPSPADHSAWGTLAVMQPVWEPKEPKLAISYREQDVRIELSQHGELLLDGIWTAEVRLGKEILQAESKWEDLCWVSDKDIDYLELEIQLSRGVRIQRHMAMAREDRFLLLADTILGCPAGTIDYRGRISLGEDAGLAPAEETHEAFLMGKKAAALVLPLAFPEWRIEHSPGTLAGVSGAVELQMSGHGALFAPLFLDLKPRRMTKPLTWRRLTVAQSLEIVPDNVAVGYRAMVGKEQWLIYRSLTPAANRTLLGHNLATEMLIARFEKHGEVEPLVEIEGEIEGC